MQGFRLDRREALGGFAALGASALLPSAASALDAKPRHRVIIDNDFAGDPDGLFQLAHHLASPTSLIALVIGSHLHPKELWDPSDHQGETAAERARELIATMRLAREPEVIAGRNAALVPGAPSEPSNAARRIIAEAMRTDTKLPLFYCAGAGLTDLAEAVRSEPAIAGKLTLIWIGGPEYAELRPGVPARTDREYNYTIDPAAAQYLFNDSQVPIWQIPRNVYRQMMISHAELEAGLRGAGATGAFLLGHLQHAIDLIRINLGETYILGDSPLVTLTALQSSFEPDSSSSAYVVRPTPRINDAGRYEAAPDGRPIRVYTSIDTRLTFADMFAKLATAHR